MLEQGPLRYWAAPIPIPASPSSTPAPWASGLWPITTPPGDIGEPNTTDPSVLVINGGTLAYKGASVATDRGVTSSLKNGTISITNPATTLTLNGLITGPGLFITAGTGTFVLTNANNSQARRHHHRRRHHRAASGWCRHRGPGH